MNLPNIWGAGAIFAFSGLDGEVDYKSCLDGVLSGDEIGILFNKPGKPHLRFYQGEAISVEYDIVASDIIKVWITERFSNERTLLRILFAQKDVVVGSTMTIAIPMFTCHPDLPVLIHEGCTKVWGREGEYYGLCELREGKEIKFCLAYSQESAHCASEKAVRGVKSAMESLEEQKLMFFTLLPKVDSLNEMEEKTFYKCFSVMKSQVYTPQGIFISRWTTPDRIPHRKLWLWDSVFHSFGNRYISKELAYETIKAVFDTQQVDGFIPIMADPDDVNRDETQPPVLAWGIWDMYQFSKDEAILHTHLESLEKYLHWNMQNRDTNKNWLFEWKVRKEPNPTCRCGECGMDNSSRFDDAKDMDCIDFSCFMAQEARCMEMITKKLGIVEKAKYWADVYQKIKYAINRNLWDPTSEMYFDRILEDRSLKKVWAVSSFLPLFAGVCENEQAEALVRHLNDPTTFATAFGIPSIAKNDPTFGSDMWRGPVWINFNYMIILGLREFGYTALADKLKRQTIETMAFWYGHDGVIYEFYDSEDRISPSRFNRKGPNVQPYQARTRIMSIRDYGWSCTLYPALVLC